MRYTPENITELKLNEVFVFGANCAGIHGAGAAKLALKWGAKMGYYGLNGQTYGIPTKDENFKVLPLEEIGFYIDDFLLCAKENPDKIFLVTKIGTGLSRYSINDIAQLFGGKYIPNNVVLPKEFSEYLFGE